MILLLNHLFQGSIRKTMVCPGSTFHLLPLVSFLCAFSFLQFAEERDKTLLGFFLP